MKNKKFFYCPSCGDIHVLGRCVYCNDRRIMRSQDVIEPKESCHTYKEYIDRAEIVFGDPFKWREVFEMEELLKNEQFNIDKYHSMDSYKHHLYLCPVCAKHYNTLDSAVEITCRVCGHSINLYKSAHALEYYHIRSMVLFGDFYHNRDVIIEEELSHTALFNREEASKITVENQYAPEWRYKTANISNTNTPKCPTCQSSNIKKISSAKRSLYTFAFGIFNKTAQSQFECNNCGYKW